MQACDATRMIRMIILNYLIVILRVRMKLGRIWIFILKFRMIEGKHFIKFGPTIIKCSRKISFGGVAEPPRAIVF